MRPFPCDIASHYSYSTLVPRRSHPLACQLRPRPHCRPVAGAPEIVSRRIARDRVHRRDHARPSRTGGEHSAPRRANGRFGRAAVRGSRQSACATVVDHRRQYCLRDGRRGLCELDRRSGGRGRFGRRARDLCDVRAALRSPAVGRGRADRGPRRSGGARARLPLRGRADRDPVGDAAVRLPSSTTLLPGIDTRTSPRRVPVKGAAHRLRRRTKVSRARTSKPC